ncbi:mandelate racemase/muconate lactonizing enzyme family protein [Shimazuella kribbensis]|uniref:mandelate racemase/muconate lactonizing enzyme family protein n=1 Tax=Shimazuella kribbensis TaxID=139808 RepID=UPI00041E3F44|nr:dipeptide epimerase [Shimazuella kribbensis]
MKIVKADLFGIQLPLKEPFIISYSRYDYMPSIIVRLETDEGLIGYGEAVPDEHVTGETFSSVIQVLKQHLLPVVLGMNPFSIEQIHHSLNQTIYANPSAKAAIDIACYDLMGKYAGQPIYNLIGGEFHKNLTFPAVLSIDEPTVMAANAKKALSEGYSYLKLKLGHDPYDDIQRVKAIRHAVGPEVIICVDINQGWHNYSQAIRSIRELESYDIAWVEQPIMIHDIDGLAELKKHTTLPIMADESIQNGYHLIEIIKKQAADRINIKLMKCGGIFPAIQLTKMAEYAGLSCQIGSMVESSIASAAGYHVAKSHKNITHTELTGPLLFSEDIGDLAYDLPFAALTSKPGLGIEVNMDKIQKLTITKETVRLP